MKTVPLNFLAWLRDSASGFGISGSSGTGKSCLMRLIMNFLARSHEGFFLLDPHGDLARDAEADLSSMPKYIQDRVVLIRACDIRSGVATVNPLDIPQTDGDEIRWRARLTTKVKHTAMILLAAWGESDFDSRPVLYKWTIRFLMLLALARLPISAVRYFFDTSHPVYAALTRYAPDFVTRMELQDLADLRPKDREDIIASTKNRFLGLLSNPIIELLLSRTENVLDCRELIQRRAIVVISLEKGEGELDESDVQILANLWLAEIAFAIFNTPRDQRQWTTVFLDELPVFSSSYPLLQTLMPSTRKLKCRWVMAFQGAFVFPND